MVASTTPPSTEPARAEPTVRRLAVACSGGRDSMALLHATARMAAELNAELPDMVPMQVVALHVHHGLSPHADDWLALVRSSCETWAAQGLPVSFDCRRVTVPLGNGLSVEAEARRARYAALAEMAHAARCSTVWLAHHRRDQAETFLLQALRSAGAAGLSAMPAQAVRDGICWVRPWLGRPREDIEAYIARHRLAFVNDESNLDDRFSRNRMRRAVWPVLSAAFDGAEVRLSQAASHQADLKACLDDWLAWQLPQLTRTLSGRLALEVSPWLARAPGPQRELLRAWFIRAAGVPLTMNGVRRLQQDLLRMAARHGGRAAKGSARWPLPKGSEAAQARPRGPGEPAPRAVLAPEVVLHKGWLSVREIQHADDAGPSADRDVDMPLSIAGCGEVLLPAGLGHLAVVAVEQGGVALSRLTNCRLRSRRGGEQFQLAPGRPARSLKKQFQSVAMPSWERHGPVLYAGGQLVFVPGLGIDARAWAPEGEPQVQLRWRPMQIGGRFDHACIPDAKTAAGS